MIEVTITPTMLQEAQERFNFGVLNGSITRGEGNLAGALGEVASIHYLQSKGYRVEDTSTYDYDIIVNGHKVDVKTKRQRHAPLPHNRVTVSSWNTKQQCDFYFFATALYNHSYVYLNGYYQKEAFFREADFKHKGDGDPEGGNTSFIFTHDCYVLHNHQIHKFK